MQRRQCCSFAACFEQVDCFIKPVGPSPGATMWSSCSSGSKAKSAFGSVLNQDAHIMRMLKLLNAPEEDEQSDAFIILVPKKTAKSIDFYDEIDRYLSCRTSI